MQADTDVAYLYRIAVSDVGFTCNVSNYNTTKQEQAEECGDVLHSAFVANFYSPGLTEIRVDRFSNGPQQSSTFFSNVKRSSSNPFFLIIWSYWRR